MQIIIPMAGIGQRFQFAGYKDPKPLIDIDGKPVIEHIVEMFPGENDFIFITNENHIRETVMESILKRIKPNSKIVPIAQHKLGPVHTVIQASDYIKDEEPVMICYCDVNVHWDFELFKKKMQESDADAGLIVFKGFHPPLLQEGFYATARADEDTNRAHEVREKFSFTPNKMDSWTSAGMHYFKKGATVKKYFKQLIDSDTRVNDEFYVSMIHNLTINDGLKNVIFPVDFFISWGKPEDVREYLYWSNHFGKNKQ